MCQMYYYECKTIPFKKYPRGMFISCHSVEDDIKIVQTKIESMYKVVIEDIKREPVIGYVVIKVCFKL